MNTEFLDYLGFKTFNDLFFNIGEHRHTGSDIPELLDCVYETIERFNEKCNSEMFMELKDRLEFNYNHLLKTDWIETEKNNFLNPWGFHS